MKLPIPVEPNSRESFAGYIWRLSEANGYSSVDHMRKALKLSPALSRSLVRPYVEDFEKVIKSLIAITTNFSADALLETCFADLPSKSERKFNVNAPLLDWRTSLVRICPDCLEQNGMILKEWQHLTHTVCPTHNKQIIHKCPSCNTQIELHADLIYKCHHCNVEWKTSCRKVHQLPAYQDSLINANDKNQWLFEFGWSLLKVARPMDLQHNCIKNYDAPLDDLRKLLDRAWQLQTDPQFRHDFQAMRAFRFATLSGLMLNEFDVKIGLPNRLGVPENEVESFYLMPRWARDNYSSDMIGWSIDTENLIKALNIELICDSLPTDDHEYFHYSLRKATREIIARLGFDEVRKEAHTRKRRYDIRGVNKWVEEIPAFESVEQKLQLYWVTADDPALRIHGVDIVELVNDIRSGELKGYRRLYSGINPIGVDPDALRVWLKNRLTQLCSAPVLRYTALIMTQLSKQSLSCLAKDGVITFEKGENGCAYVNGDSLMNYINNNQSNLRTCSSPNV